MSLTLEHILRLPVVQAGHPEVLCGEDRVGQSVRWVHVAELKSLSGLLQGGELVLTTGLAFAGSPTEAGRYLEELAALGAAGVVVEITADRRAAEAALREAAQTAPLPVVLVTRRIRFVEVTEVVHRMIVAAQLEQVERARHMHEVFTALSLESAPADEIVARAAQLLAAPVVLEDLSHLVVAFDSAGTAAAELLRDWEGRSRAAGFREETVRTGDEGWLQTPVGLRGQRWGRLVVPFPADDDGEAAMVLERAGQALSINRMAERDQRDLGHQAQAGLLHELRQPRSLAETDALTRAAALGLRPAPLYLPVVFRLDRSMGQEPIAIQRSERALLDLLTQVLASSRNSALAASLQTGSVAVLLALPARQLEDSVLERVCGELADLAAAGSEPLGWTVGAGRSRPDLLIAAAGLDEAAQVAETASTLQRGSRRFFRSADVRLRGLLSLLRHDPRVQTFVEAELGGVLDGADAEVDADLDLLQRYLESGGNKSELARTGYLSRPTLYSRLAKLEQRLGVRLDDAESRTSLHVALLVHRLGGL